MSKKLTATKKPTHRKPAASMQHAREPLPVRTEEDSDFIQKALVVSLFVLTATLIAVVDFKTKATPSAVDIFAMPIQPLLYFTFVVGALGMGRMAYDHLSESATKRPTVNVLPDAKKLKDQDHNKQSQKHFRY